MTLARGVLRSWKRAMGLSIVVGALPAVASQVLLRRGSEFQVNAYTTRQWQPAVDVAPNGDFVVAWSGQGAPGSGDDIFARRFDASGTPVGLDATTGWRWPPEPNGPGCAASRGPPARGRRPQKSEIPDLLKRLAQLREEATKEERERYRYKLIEEEPPAGRPAPP